MPVYNDPSGGLAGGLCLVSPSDQAGMIDNLVSRVAYLEQVVSLILGHDITAGTLSEITDQLGTVTNATLINAANGWTTDGTFSGVAISTLGWVMADGNTYPIVSVNPDGSLNFGFSTTGAIAGQAVDAWNNNAAVAVDYGIAWNSTGLGAFDDTRGVTVTINQCSLAGMQIEMQVTQAGLYACSGLARKAISASTSYDFSCQIETTPYGTFLDNGMSARAFWVGGNSNNSATLSVNGLMVLGAGAKVRLFCNSLGGLSTAAIQFHIHRVSG